ncbi:MAG TPA: phosphoadenylyl-sulfate reductase [Nitrospirales bacterium]|nr:phosphoadenylyl-sulfate reductase [Nitrospirales bacterium]
MATTSAAEFQTLSDAFETQTPQDVLAYAIGTYFPDIVLASSFGAEDVVLIDMAHRINPKTPILYLDTDFLFKETYETRDRLIQKYGITPIQVKSLLTPDQQAEKLGDKLWERRPDECCNQRKVEPLTRVLKSYKAWITGIRREQSPTRANAKLVEWDPKFELVKFNPLAKWKWQDVWTYIKLYEVPYNPLHDQNYPSIGCTYCTRPVQPGEDPRAGRWAGFAKTECGLHVK